MYWLLRSGERETRVLLHWLENSDLRIEILSLQPILHFVSARYGASVCRKIDNLNEQQTLREKFCGEICRRKIINDIDVTFIAQ